MECVKCKRSGEFNRVVVNQLSKRELGLFCEDCEQETFGELLQDSNWHNDNGCAFCDGDGKFTLPTLECLIEADDGSVRHVEYETLFDPVQLCERHLGTLLPPERSVSELLPTERELQSSLEA